MTSLESVSSGVACIPGQSRFVFGGLAIAAVLTLTACMPEGDAEGASKTDTHDPAPSATFLSVIDGDTIETSDGTVRLIGIDAPERGECGYDDAAAVFTKLLVPGDPIVLVLPAGQNEQDAYGRLLRYVETQAGDDFGLMQLTAGNAVARYDSADGYPRHPSEALYRSAQTATLSVTGDVVTVACHQASASVPEPVQTLPPAVAAPEPSEPSELPWWMQYDSCAKLKRNQVGHPTGPFDVTNPEHAQLYEWFAHQTGNRGDGDGDGLACE